MKILRVLAGTLALFGLLVPAWAEVRTIAFSQILTPPPGQTFTFFARNVAIDGSSIIVLGTHDGGESAYLYQRSSGSSEFTYRKTLLTFVYPRDRMQVRMKNGIAVVHFGDRAWIFERVGNNYVLGQTAAPLRHPGGVAISAKSILIGGDNCEYDAVVYEKRADGIWDITGRMDDNQGQCHPEGRAVELNYNEALLQEPGETSVKAWRRNGTALDWVPDGTLSANMSVPAIPRIALQNSTAVTPGSKVDLHEGNAWNTKSFVRSLNAGEASSAIDVVYRDGVLITTQTARHSGSANPYAYIETAPGFFEHVAFLDTGYRGYKTIDHDISGRTVVVADEAFTHQGQAFVFVLPEPLAAAPPIPDDFEDHDVSDFTFVSGQFALATRGTDDVLSQTSTSGLSLALVNDSDWNYYQRVEADIAPTLGTADAWVGLVARYTDANNYYFAAVRNDNTVGIYRRLNGVTKHLREGSSNGARPSRMRLLVSDQDITVWIDRQFVTIIPIDRSLPHGRAGLATFHATADFDDVHVSATPDLQLLRNLYVPDGDFVLNDDDVAPFDTIGGDWQLRHDSNGFLDGFQQLDSSRSALAFIGGPVRNQEIDVGVLIDSVSSQNEAWVGVLGRYVNQGTHYYATLRNTNRVEIRKRVNGVSTVLAAANYVVAPGRYHEMRFRLVEDQLQLFIDETVVLSARDDEIAEGQQGLATHKATATWDRVFVMQP